MNEQKKHAPVVYRIYDYIAENCKGENNAVKGRELAEKYFPSMSVDNGKRAVRAVINTIRNDNTFDNVIASGNSGYWWAENIDPLERIRIQGLNCLKTYWTSRKKAEMNGQTVLPLTEFIKAAVESLCEVGE